MTLKKNIVTIGFEPISLGHEPNDFTVSPYYNHNCTFIRIELTFKQKSG